MGALPVAVHCFRASHRQCRHLDRNAHTTTAQRAVRSLKSGDHGHSLLTVTPRPVAAAHAVQEVLAFEPERLPPGDVWNHDLAASVGELKLPVVVGDRVLD